MSKVFPKLARSITMAAKEGGPDSETNAKLRTAILNAKSENMPKDNIDKAIARAAGKDSDNYVEANYEAKGPFGVLIWVECATDNPTRTVANVKTIFKKNEGEVVQSGALEFMFNRKTVIEFAKTDEIDLEEVELNLIDHGLEEFEVIEDTVFVYGDFKDFGPLSKATEDLGVEITKASLQRIATSPVDITDEQMEEVAILLDKLEDDEDVQAVYTNLA